MNKAETVLSFGSNLGDRKSNIEKAIAILVEEFSLEQVEISPIIETKSLGFDGPDFLDCVAVFRTTLSPANLLKACKRTEKLLGRTDEPEYAADGSRIYRSRPIDVDILFYSDVCMSTPELTIPHPQVKNREYIKELLLSLTFQKFRSI